MQISYREDQISAVASKILNASKHKTICFYAPMGAGKTTLIKAMVKHLGAIDAGNSPTFGIVNEYHNREGELLAYHFDFYRLNDETEALDLGFEDYLNRDVWTFIEWPEKITSFLPEESINVQIEPIDTTTRRITLPDQN